MKTLKTIITVCLISMLGLNAACAQNKKIITQEIPVEGVCNMCQKRIENAALIKGVKTAKWDNTTGLLTVIYTSAKTSDSTICASIALAGHDTKLVKATEENYSKLPDCCAYRDGIKKH
jgi:mercuric ion binding protein